MKPLVLLSLLLFLFLRLPAQEQVYFNKRIDFYNNYDNSRNIIETDSGYVVSGTTSPSNPIYMYFAHLSFIGLNKNGDVNFFKEYGYDSITMFLGNPGSLINLNDTAYVSAGTKRIATDNWVHDQGMLAYYNQDFDTLFTILHGEQTLPYDTSFMFYQVKQNPNTSLVLVGLRSTYDYPSSIWLLKTDSLGNKLWEKFFGDDVKYFQGHSIVQTGDGGYVIGGYKFKIGYSGTGDPLIIKTDSLGNEEWRINPGNPEVDDNKVMVALAADGNIIAGTNYGTQSSGDNQWMVVKVMKITPEGEILWDYNYGEPGYDNFLLNTTILENGNIITNGHVAIFEDNKPSIISWLLCVDDLGNELWYKEYALLTKKNSFNFLYDVTQTTDNGLIGCGMVDPGLPYDTGTVDIWVMKMNSMGCLAAACDTTVGIELIGQPFTLLQVYPNPATNWLIIDIGHEATGHTTVSFFNLYGLKVEEVEIPRSEQTLKVNTTRWQSGLYVAILSQQDKVLGRTKFVVKK